MPPKGYDDHTPNVCVCDEPRFTGPCRCSQKRHWAGECRACHRPTGPAFDHIRDAWRSQRTERVEVLA